MDETNGGKPIEGNNITPGEQVFSRNEDYVVDRGQRQQNHGKGRRQEHDREEDDKKKEQAVHIENRRGIDSKNPATFERARALMTPEKFELYEKHIRGEIDLSPIEKAALENSYTRVMDFLSYWGEFSGTYFDQSDYEVLSAMFVPEQFIKYSNEKAEKIAAKLNIHDLSNLDEKNSLKISEEIRKDMVLMFGNILRRIDNQQASEFFDEIAQQDIFKGINIANMNLAGAVRQLATHFEKHNVEGLKFNLFKTTSKTLDEEKSVNSYKHDDYHKNETDAEGNAIFTKKTNAYQRIETSSGPQKITIDEFVKKINIFGEHEYNTRKFLHNVRALSLAPPAHDKPYYSRMQGFAEQMSTTDLDEIALLPDYDVVSTAGQLYAKIIQEELVKNDWKHTPTMFTREPGELYTKCEREALDQLALIFRDRFAEEGASGGNVRKDDWRLRRAFDMAMGIARGIDMKEVEYAAYADPVLTGEGKPRFTSYYTTDPNALTPFDPKHMLLRFQMEELFPMLMAPIEGENLNVPYDHKATLKATDEFFNSFTMGKKAFSNPDQKLLIDLIQNIGNIGGLPRRAGWRWEAAAEGWYIDNSPENGQNHLENVKRVGNIGFEIMSYYMSNHIKNEFLEGKNFDTKVVDSAVVQKRDEFFKYLFSNYIDPKVKPENIDGEYQNFLSKVRAKGKTGDVDVYKYLINRSLVGCIYNRFPSFLIKNERNRFSAEGTRTWVELKQKKSDDILHPELDISKWDNNRFDQAMKNLGLAETLLRLRVSQEMDAALAKGESISAITSRYVLDESIMEGLFKENMIKPEQLVDLKNLFKVIKSSFLNDEKKADSFIKKFIGNDREYRYTVGLEELDSRYLSHRATGFRPIARAAGDIAMVESDVTQSLIGILAKMKTVAVAHGDKRDTSGLIELIQKAKTAIEKVHGVEPGEKLAYNLTKLVITYFRKDDIARPWLGLAGVNRKNSMAAELIGKAQGVWEWDSVDIDNFLTSIESAMILRKSPLHFGSFNVDKQYVREPIKMFGKELPQELFGMKLPFTSFKKPKDSQVNFSRKMRENVRAMPKDIVYDLMNKYGLLAFIALLYSWMSKSFEENFKNKESHDR
jgi:hypothetical protein